MQHNVFDSSLIYIRWPGGTVQDTDQLEYTAPEILSNLTNTNPYPTCDLNFRCRIFQNTIVHV